MITHDLKVTHCTQKGWRVDKDDKYVEHLTWEEMIAQVIGLTIPDRNDFWGMQTPAQWEAQERRLMEQAEAYDHDPDFKMADDDDVPRDVVAKLRNEINCRIEHGADSRGHLEYVQSKLDEILKEAQP